MHRSLEITVDPAATDGLVEQLKDRDGVISLVVHRGASIQPPGDVISAAVLNQETDAILHLVLDGERHGPVSIATGTLDSLIDSQDQDQVRTDVDEVTWEEAETALRRHTRPNLNFFLTTVGGGIIAAGALSSSSGVTEATALVAAAIISPVFEPLARTAIAAVNRRGALALRSVVRALVGFLTLIASAVLTMLVLRAAGPHYVSEFLRSSTLHEVEYPPTVNLIVSAAAAVVGAVMVAAGRFTQLSGPLVALQLLPAAAAVGDALELGDGGIAARSLGRLAIDLGMVLIACLIVFTYKHVTVHQRRPLRQ